ncbi:MAG: VWA domain-containing protein [Candidatus Acidiferrales bacterium]
MAEAACRAVITCLLVAKFAGTPSVLSSELRAAQGPGAITQDIRLVLLPVTVTDRKGEFVSGLEESNFRVYEDGRPQHISLFRHEDVSVTVGIAVDHSGSMAARSDQVIEGAVAFVQASNPQDREFVVNFDEKPTFSLPSSVEFTSNVSDLRAALSTPYASGRTALFDAIQAALEHFDQNDSGKKVILLISDGGDNASKHTFAQVLRLAQSSNVIIYSVGLLDEHSADQNPNILRKLARDTGGQAYFPNSGPELVNVCRQIAADIRHQYTLGYSPPDNGRPGYRKLRATVNAPGRGKVFVRTRPGYSFPSATSNPSVAEKVSAP